MATRQAIAGSLTPELERVCVVCEDLQSFPAAILELITHPQERKRLGRAAWEYFMTNFTWSAVEAEYRQLLEEMH